MENNYGYLKSLALSPGWAQQKKLMQEIVDAALVEIAGETSNDPMAYMKLHIRWQQRVYMMGEIIRTVEAYKNGNDTDNPNPGDSDSSFYDPASFQ